MRQIHVHCWGATAKGKPCPRYADAGVFCAKHTAEQEDRGG